MDCKGMPEKRIFSSGEESETQARFFIGDHDRNLEPEGWSRQDDGRD